MLQMNLKLKKCIVFVVISICLFFSYNSTVLAETRADVPSIFFIVDNSGSMFLKDYNIDRWGRRFEFVQSMIDSINSIYPSAEIGLSVFGSHLYFDPLDDENTFKRVSNNSEEYYKGAYIPLCRLDSSYTYVEGIESGYGILKYYLQLDTSNAQESANAGQDYITLKYRPTDTVLSAYSTNITAAFEAAKDAFSISSIQKKNQFIIFLSDGAATFPSANDSIKDLYIQGEDVPATYTIFFTEDQTIPEPLHNMTTNIKNNSYSETNSESSAFAYSNIKENLFNFLINSIVTVVSSTSNKLISKNYIYKRQLNISSISNNKFLLSNESDISNLEISIYNAFGKVANVVTMKNLKIGNSIVELNRPLSNGCYFYNVKTYEHNSLNFSGSFIID